ncbi:MAG: LacI family DNA-binding transcriptional regulator [Aestuariivirga sp.]
MAPRQKPPNPKRIVVLKDVARLAGVDASTASRVLRGDDRKPAKPETRDRVLAAAHEMGYRANSIARSLRTHQREAIGLIIPDAANPGFAQIFKSVQAVMTEAGWHVIVVEGSQPARPHLCWDRIVFEGRVDGVLVLTATIRDPVVRRVAESGFPLVVVNRRSYGVAGSVVMNDAWGSEIAVRHFHDLGHRRIGHIAGPSNLDTGRRRLAGYRDALKRRKLPMRAEWIAVTDYTEAGGFNAAQEIMSRSRGDLPTAIYVATFMSGLGAVQAFNEAGLRVPVDVSIIVSDEISLAAHTAPPLTTVDMPVTRMGEIGARMLIGAVAGEPVSNIVLPDEPRLVVRASTAPPRVR